MGKKVKKKARSGHKEKPGTSASPETASNSNNVEKHDRGVCPHIEKGINLDRLSAKLGISQPLKCEDCRENITDRRANKVKGKHGKKGGLNSKSESKAVWICLECGHLYCGGVGLPTTPQSHAVRHAKQYHHPLAVHYENPQLLWCFPCSQLISVEKSPDTGDHKDILQEVLKMLKGRPGERSTVDVEDVWFGSGSVTGATKLDYSLGTISDGKNGHLVRGLANLGNTCFFNSIMQNLLALNGLRDYFSKLDESVGPLSSSLRKLFLETSAESGLRNVINPRSLFGSVCTKAPQFRGYQQHDSHELLRCLLDSLSTEELSARKNLKSGPAGQTSLSGPTFVDTIFGGELSSTVSCLECGHSSTIYEPFLDLSLPVPTKKPPPKRVQSLARGKKAKIPPKRSARLRPKISRETCTLPAESVSDQSADSNSFSEVQSRVQSAEHLVLPAGDSALSDLIDPNSIALDMGLTPADLSAIQKPQNQQPVDDVKEQSISPDSLSWLDYLDQHPVSNDIDVASENDEISANITQKPQNQQPVDNFKEQSVSPDSFSWLEYLDPHPVSNDIDLATENDEISAKMVSKHEDIHNDVSLPATLASSSGSDSGHATSAASSFNTKQFDSLEPNVFARQQLVSQIEDEENAVSQFENKQNHVSQDDGKLDSEGSLIKKAEQGDIDISYSSASCNQICSKDPHLSVCGLESDNVPSQVQDSEVILLPYKEAAVSSEVEISTEIDISLAVIGGEQDNVDFDGFGDLFNEPESTLTLGPSESHVSEEKTGVKSGGIGNSSDSDPDEVDDSDVPVSIESCLTLFTKPELLSKDEHAWQCDNCSKVMREKIVKSRRNSQKPGTKILPNGCMDRNPSALQDVGDNSYEVNRTVEENIDAPNGRSLLENKENYDHGNCMLENQPESEMNVMTCQLEHQEQKLTNAVHDPCPSLSQSLDSCSFQCETNKVRFAQTNFPSGNCESGKSDVEEEANSQDLKVKRDATKNILIKKAPPILTIHLKRFSHDARGRLSKLNGHVNFRETLDLKPYMDPRGTDIKTCTYRLVGVVEHSGTMRGGHYVAYVRGCKSNEDCVWYHASDAYVREASLEEVLRCEAYILFYEGT